MEDREQTPEDRLPLVIICPGCKSLQRRKTTCEICKAPLFEPNLQYINSKWVLFTYDELEEMKNGTTL